MAVHSTAENFQLFSIYKNFRLPPLSSPLSSWLQLLHLPPTRPTKILTLTELQSSPSEPFLNHASTLAFLRLEQALTSLLTVQGHLPRMTLAPLCACLRKLKASRRMYSLFQPAPEGRGPVSTPHWEARSLTNISTCWQIQMGFILVNAVFTFCNFSHP